MIINSLVNYVIYIISALIGFYILGRYVNRNIFTKIPIYLLIATPFTNSWLLSIFFGLEVNAAYCDDKNDCDVYDIWHIITAIAIIIYAIINFDPGTITITDLIPIIFVILTITTRGFSDTIFMLLFAIVCLLIRIDYIWVIISFFIGYLLQVIIQINYCKENKIELKKHPMLPFLPALYVGCNIGVTIYALISLIF